MSTDNQEINIVWTNWLSELPKGFQSGNEELEFLENQFIQLSSTRQRERLDVMLHIVLTKGFAHWIALKMLEKRATLDERRMICQLYLNDAKTIHDVSYLQDLIDALSFEQTDEFVTIINDFLLLKPLGKYWVRPSEELFNNHPELYLKGWNRFFKERPIEEWSGNGYVQSFLSQPNSIVALKNYLILNDKPTWDKFKMSLLEWIEKPFWPPTEQKELAKQIILE